MLGLLGLLKEGIIKVIFTSESGKSNNNVAPAGVELLR